MLEVKRDYNDKNLFTTNKLATEIVYLSMKILYMQRFPNSPPPFPASELIFALDDVLTDD
jgi:hypothetical protein